METFSVIIEGHPLDGFDPSEVKTRLAKLTRQTEDVAARLLAGGETTVKSGVDTTTGERFVTALRAIGVACRVEPDQLELDVEAVSLPATGVAPPSTYSRNAGPRATNSIAPEMETTSSTSIGADPSQAYLAGQRYAAFSSANPLLSKIASFGAVFIVVLLGFLTFDDLSQRFVDWKRTGLGGLTTWFATDDRAKTAAGQIIRENLSSPASYKVARQDTLWSKSIGDETAYIVRTEYDAQSGFGALLRDCQYTSFVIKGDKFTFNPLNGMQPCADRRDSSDWEDQKRQIVPALIKNAGFDRFGDAPPLPSASPRGTIGPFPVASDRALIAGCEQEAQNPKIRRDVVSQGRQAWIDECVRVAKILNAPNSP